MSELTTGAPTTQELRKALTVSLVIHVVLVLSFIVKLAFFPDENYLYESAVRVDIVDLPDKVKNIAPQLTPAQKEELIKPVPQEKPMEPIATPVKPEEPSVNLAQKKELSPNLKKMQDESLSKLKRLSAIEKIKQQQAEEQALREQLQKEKDQKLKGNVLSSGTQLSGLNLLQHENYISQIDRHIKTRWALPEWLAKQKLTAQIRLRIDLHGYIIDADIVKSSGNPDYDESVMMTVKDSSPYPIPPEKFRDIVAVKGILLGFPE